MSPYPDFLIPCNIVATRKSVCFSKLFLIKESILLFKFLKKVVLPCVTTSMKSFGRCCWSCSPSCSRCSAEHLLSWFRLPDVNSFLRAISISFPLSNPFSSARHGMAELGAWPSKGEEQRPRLEDLPFWKSVQSAKSFCVLRSVYSLMLKWNTKFVQSRYVVVYSMMI